MANANDSQEAQLAPAQVAEAQQGEDLIAIDESLPVPATPSGQDSVLNAAHVFENQLEQMTAWKHQLSQQMELLRRDGIKILERQKNLALEKKKIADERNQIAADRQYVQKLHRDLQEQTQAMNDRVLGVKQQQTNIDSARHELGLREAEFSAREKAFQEREAQFLSRDIQVKETLEQIEEQRKQLLEGRRELSHNRQALEIQQQELEELKKTQASQQERWNALEARAADISMQEEASAKKTGEIASRQEQLHAEKHAVDEAQGRLLAAQEKLIADEKQFAEQRASLTADLQSRLTAAEAGQRELEQQRQALAAQRQELNKKVETIENEHAEQLESLAKQTKRISERRAEVEARASELDKDAEARIAGVTAGTAEQIARLQQEHAARLAELEKQLQQNTAEANDWSVREAELKTQLDAAGAQIAALQRDLTATTEQHGAADRERAELTRLLAEQMVRYENDSADWKRKLDAAATDAKADPSAPALQQALDAAQAAKNELEQWRARVQQLEASQSQGSADQTQQISMLEQQRNELAAQLFASQDAMKRQSQEALLTKNALEAQLTDLRQNLSFLEAEKSAWKSRKPAPAASQTASADNETINRHRDRLLRQARGLRAYRRQVREGKVAQEGNREEIAHQREQLRVRKENLEQVKRLLEKQEMVMARKLADHNALKTVAAVGIFVIMILGSVFIGVYKFVNPLYRGEAIVQLAQPANVQGQDLPAWVNHQAEQVRANEITYAAWKTLRSGDDHYTVHDVREEWLASLSDNLILQPDAGSKTIAIRYTGSNAEGVAQVCNALAMAFTTPTSRDNTPQTADVGFNATVAARAEIPANPVKDNRLTISLSVSAGALFVSLIFVILFRHYVARQLKEIDQMADEKDLADMHAELPDAETPQPA